MNRLALGGGKVTLPVHGRHIIVKTPLKDRQAASFWRRGEQKVTGAGVGDQCAEEEIGGRRERKITVAIGGDFLVFTSLWFCDYDLIQPFNAS